MPIQLRFTLTFEDYMNAMRLHAKKNWWLCLNYFAARFVLPVLGVLLILTAVPLLIGSMARVFPVFPVFLICFGVFLSLYPWYYRARLKRCYRRTRTGGGDTTVEIGEEKIYVETENTNSELTWKAVQFYREDKHLFMLYLAPAKFVALPKRTFSPELITELQSLLRRKLAQPGANPS